MNYHSLYSGRKYFKMSSAEIFTQHAVEHEDKSTSRKMHSHIRTSTVRSKLVPIFRINNFLVEFFKNCGFDKAEYLDNDTHHKNHDGKFLQ